MKATRWNIYWALLFLAGVMAVFKFSPDSLFPDDYVIKHPDLLHILVVISHYSDLFNILASLGLIYLLVYAVKRFNQLTWLESIQFIGIKKPNLPQILVGLASCLPLLFYYIYMIKGEESPIYWNDSSSQWWSWSSTTKFIVVDIFFVELFYRGFLFRLFRQNRSFISAAVLTGLFWFISQKGDFFWGYPWDHEGLFVHLNGQGFFVQMISTVLLSILAAFLFEKGGNVIWGWAAFQVGLSLISNLFHYNGQSIITDDIFGMGQFLSYGLIISMGLIIWALSPWLSPRTPVKKKRTKMSAVGLTAP